MTDKQIRSDMAFLLSRPEFLKFLFRVIQTARIHDGTTDGSDGRNLEFHEGRRNLGLEVLRDAAQGQPSELDQDAAFALTVIQALREAAQQPKSENRKDHRRYDRTAELTADEPTDADPDADAG